MRTTFTSEFLAFFERVFIRRMSSAQTSGVFCCCFVLFSQLPAMSCLGAVLINYSCKVFEPHLYWLEDVRFSSGSSTASWMSGKSAFCLCDVLEVK